MKLIRHILSHLILIMIIFGLISVYYYRYLILPDNYVQKIDSYAEKIHPALKTFARQTQQKKNAVAAIAKKIKQVEDDTVSRQSKADIDVTASEEQIEPAQSDVAVAEVSESPSDVPMSEEEKRPQTETENSAEIQSAAQTEKDTTPELAESVEHDTEVSNDVSNDKDVASETGLLYSARNAFHQGKLDVAIQKYKELTELENDEADYFGELGNVYYAMGKWRKAGLAYYEAAVRLIDKNKFSQVVYLQRVIQGLNPDYADKLADRLAAVKQTSSY